jgi:hypothetical protein
MTRPPSPKIWRPRTDGAQYLITSIALPILPLAVSGGLVCAEAAHRVTSKPANTMKYFIVHSSLFINATNDCTSKLKR